MKRILLLAAAVLLSTVSYAKEQVLPMLEQGKTWVYVYHHFEDNENDDENGYDETQWKAYYTLSGDTVIDGRQYMKMYRWDENSWTIKYYGAFREDEEGRVWQYDKEGDKKDYMLADFTLSSYPSSHDVTTDYINNNGKLLQRYKRGGIIGVEGVGLSGKGLVHDLYEPEVDCICDYETFSYVMSDKFYFEARNFWLPEYIVLTDAEQQLVKNNNDFAFRLFRQTYKETNNFVISPLSITYALGMLNNGAAGQTKEEIDSVLGFKSVGADVVNAFCQKMIQKSNTLDKDTKALISNTIFVNEGLGYQLQAPFVSAASQYFFANPEARHFNDGETLGVINKWASDHTNGMIKEVLSAQEFNPMAVSILLNALYFKGTWTSKFKEEDTKVEYFQHAGLTTEVTYCEMMHQEDEFLYEENDLYQAICLPYGNGAYRMTVYLPRENVQGLNLLGDVISQMNSSNWKIKGHNCEVDLKLPRFETDTDINLKETMKALGMTRAFDYMLAEFPNFCNADVYIELMKQVAKIKVNEEGTEAAAATAVVLPSAIVEPVKFYANRPFLYVISEQSTDIILFMGQYVYGDNGGATGILPVKTIQPQSSPTLFDLQGRRLSAEPKHGVYIRNGKKVVK